VLLKGKRFWKLGLLAIGSVIWILLRSGVKPTRLSYPCQQAALTNIHLFRIAVLAFFPSLSSFKLLLGRLRPIAVLSTLVVGTLFFTNNSIIHPEDYTLASEDDYSRVPIVLDPQTASISEGASNLFFVQNASGTCGTMNQAVDTLIDMMSSEDLFFFETTSTPSGLIGSSDVVLLKVNGQWASRGGTNTDLVKGIIQSIIDHPDGFTGEVIIADNGQGLGSMDFPRCNAFNHSQSMMSIASLFSFHNVTTYLWDDIRHRTVSDYNSDDFRDGYVRSETWNSDTEIYPSYPKFRTECGTYVSFKNGVWNNETGFDSERLKIINMPVMKSHFRYGVTGCVKNYMGVPQGYRVSTVHSTIPHEHFSIGLGGMGTLMVETRAPTLHILDMTWINPHPMESSTRRGPWSTYSSAVFTDIIGVSQDSIAMDYWASKNILCAAAEYLNYTEYSSLDPDYAPLSDQYYGIEEMDESFHNYLSRTEGVLKDADYQATMNTSEMNVFVDTLSGHPIVSTTPSDSTTTTTTNTTGQSNKQVDRLLMAIFPLSASIIVLVLVLVKRRTTE
jgi:uncharacterized protein (DUF362 family)